MRGDGGPIAARTRVDGGQGPGGAGVGPEGAPRAAEGNEATLECAGPGGEPIVRPREPMEPGEIFAGTPYVVVRLLGQGGMGEVYEVEHAELGRRAALKVLHRDHLDRPDLAARLREEARLLARVEHPNLVEVFDLGMTTDGRPYFAMPLLRGRDLRDELCRSGPMPQDRAIGLIAQALDGLGRAHAAGMVHRDVKLENLFLEDDGTVRVLDFGVAKVLHAGRLGRTAPGTSPGTPRTMAPEQCAGAAVDARADLYAVGLALHELCTGRGPFDEVQADPHAIRFAHCEREPAPPGIGAELDALVLKALAKTPAARFQTAAEMATALRGLLPPPRVDAPVPRPAHPRPRPGRRRPRRGGRAWVPALAGMTAVAFFALGLAFGRTLPLVGAPDRAPPPYPAVKL